MNIYIDLRYTCPSRVSFLADIEISSAITGDNSLAAVPKSWKISFSPLRNAAPYCSKTPSSPDRPLAGQFGRKTRKFPEIVTANPSNQFIPVALEKKKRREEKGGGQGGSFGSRSFQSDNEPLPPVSRPKFVKIRVTVGGDERGSAIIRRPFLIGPGHGVTVNYERAGTGRCEFRIIRG